MREPLFIVSPNHLGDGVMARPAVAAMARATGAVRVAAPGWGRFVYGDLGLEVVSRKTAPHPRETAVLLAPSFRVAWRARNARRRVGLATDGRWPLLTEAVVTGGGHRRDDYRRVASVLGVEVSGYPSFPPPPDVALDPLDLPHHVGLNPVSASGETVQWPGFEDLAEALALPVRVYVGPGEQEALDRCFPRLADRPRLAELPLDDLAGALTRCRVLVSNDSGMAHFAAACGVTVVTIHGSTTASRTGVAGADSLEGPPLSCRPCYRKRCPFGVPCLDVPVQAVADRVRHHWEASEP